MAENTDTGDESLENLLNSNSEKPSDKNIPSIDTDIIIPQQETENMETHAHHLHHAPGKRIWHYFYEFLMLFLAVFCGFFAENQREHIAELKREKEFMKSMLTDLRADTTNFSAMIRGISSIDEHIDSIIPLLSNFSELNNNAAEIYQHEIWLNLYYKNIYTDRTIEQLKNSGSFRLIGNKAVSDGIIEYDGYVRNFIIDMQNELLLIEARKVDDCGTGIFKSVVFKDWLKEGFKKGFTSNPVPLPSAPYFLSSDRKQFDTYVNLLGKYEVSNYWFIQNTRQGIKINRTLDSLTKRNINWNEYEKSTNAQHEYLQQQGWTEGQSATNLYSSSVRA
jgi:hypothetical protein